MIKIVSDREKRRTDGRKRKAAGDDSGRNNTGV